ncbi:hypothetical protein [Paludisphaera rhizosphaerae]|uniref:hypothetical protein n=1 Tax=Paludisphaera rhizosphaerae TaxID=2711216 RepID=UPI00197DE48F|nr:hypothetical protein [Paludisphaera rhizosphaerae]
MAEGASLRFLLIVTGSTLRAESMDRPLAYYLKRRIEEALEASTDRDLADYEVHVVADFRWLHDESLQNMATISLGGPGVNELAHRWLEEVPVALAVNERYFIQLDPEPAEAKASIWGMNNATTQIAVSVFLDRFLPRFLERCATIPPAALDLDDEGDSGPEDD